MKPILIFLCFSFSVGVNSQILSIDLKGNITNSQDAISCQFTIDSVIMEYGTCSYSPSLHLAILDNADCNFWQTNCNYPEGYSFDQTNDSCACKFRKEKYFIFNQNNPAELFSLNNVIQNIISDNQLFFIYSTMSYQYDEISMNSPELISTLSSIWGTDAMQNHQVVLFLAKKNYPVTYYSQVADGIDAEIHYSRPICASETYAGMDQNLKNQVQVYQNQSNTISIDGFIQHPDNIEILDPLGRKLSYEIISSTQNHTELQLKNFNQGLCFFYLNNEPVKLFLK